MDTDLLKSEAARAALDEVRHGMRLGIGTGSTAELFIHQLGKKVQDGLAVIGVATSRRSADLCRSLAIPVVDFDNCPELDLTIDGADEIDASLRLIKGGGGALLREKIVACASARMIVIADETKLVSRLGRFALPIEVNTFGLEATHRAISRVLRALDLPDSIALRRLGDEPFMTDGNHYILDASLECINDPVELSRALYTVPGVVEHGLFIDIANTAFIASGDGVEIYTRK